jgi:predicted site-specific integrase-resolvase
MTRDGTRAALYLRISTADQKPDLQYDGLRAYAARAGLEIVQDYCDVGVSGRREDCPQLNALMVAARNREIDCVLVWKFDRFARSMRHLLAALEEFNHLGVRFVSVQDQVDTDSPWGGRCSPSSPPWQNSSPHSSAWTQQQQSCHQPPNRKTAPQARLGA